MMHRGFTLIELLVTLALIGALALITMPFTSQWSENTRHHEAISVTERAIDLARATAMKNAFGHPAEEASSALCGNVDGNGNVNIWVDRGSSVIAPFCDPQANTIIFSSTLPKGTSIEVGLAGGANQALRCMCLNSNGEVVEDGNCNLCPEPTGIRVATGGSHETTLTL